jgi:hypothetical protein
VAEINRPPSDEFGQRHVSALVIEPINTEGGYHDEGSDYAAIESERAGLGISFVSVLPRLTPATQLGAKAVAAYAERQGVGVDTFLQAGGPPLTAEQVGRSVLEVAGGERWGHGAYLLTAAGLSPLA